MDQGLPRDVLELEEWDVGSRRLIAPTCEVLKLGNNAGVEIDETALTDALLQVEGREAIKTLVIDYNSRVKTLTCLKALPGLQNVRLYGLHLQSLDGLESFRHGRWIEINTDKNRKRDIGRIADTPVTSLTLHWANPGDLEAIARSTTIRDLDLMNCPNLPLDRWQNVPIEAMSLGGGTIDVLANTGHTGLKRLVVGGCRHLERFEGDNSTITWAVIQSCNRIDWRTITTLRRLVNLNITGVTAEIPLSAFVGLRELRTLSFGNSKLNVDAMDLKSAASQLEKLYAQVLKKEQLLELSRVNSGVLVSNGRWTYRDGAPAESK